MTKIQEYRHKEMPDGPTIHAVQLTTFNGQDIAEWCGGKLVEEIDPFTKHVTPGINVPTEGGNVRASLDSYILRTTGGSFDVGTADWFEYYFDLDDPETKDDFVVPDPDPDPHLDWGFVNKSRVHKI